MTSPWRKLPGTRPTALETIVHGQQCLWPIGARAPYTFCGAPVRPITDDRPQVYCAAHAAIAYKPKPPKEPKK